MLLGMVGVAAGTLVQSGSFLRGFYPIFFVVGLV